MPGAASRRPLRYQRLLLRPREGLPNEPVHVELRLFLEDLVDRSPRRGVGGPEEIADLRPLRDLVRADLSRDPDGLLLVEPNERAQDDERRGLVDRPKVLQGLARDLAEALPREEVRAPLP